MCNTVAECFLLTHLEQCLLTKEVLTEGPLTFSGALYRLTAFLWWWSFMQIGWKLQLSWNYVVHLFPKSRINFYAHLWSDTVFEVCVWHVKLSEVFQIFASFSFLTRLPVPDVILKGLKFSLQVKSSICETETQSELLWRKSCVFWNSDQGQLIFKSFQSESICFLSQQKHTHNTEYFCDRVDVFLPAKIRGKLPASINRSAQSHKTCCATGCAAGQ